MSREIDDQKSAVDVFENNIALAAERLRAAGRPGLILLPGVGSLLETVSCARTPVLIFSYQPVSQQFGQLSLPVSYARIWRKKGMNVLPSYKYIRRQSHPCGRGTSSPIPDHGRHV